jgi:hypothetical protein
MRALWMLFTAATAWSQVQSVPGFGTVHWGERYVEVKGIGAADPNKPAAAARPLALKAAQMDALRNALEAIKGVRIDASTTVANAMVQTDLIRTQIEGTIRSFQITDTTYMSDKTIELTLRVPLDAIGSKALAQSEWGKPTPVAGPQEISAPITPTHSSKNWTGLIIDARGLGVLPALAPKILAENGVELYGTRAVNKAWFEKWGLAGYAKSVETAQGQKDRLGTQPGIVKALRAQGLNKTDLVLSEKDAQSVLEAVSGRGIFGDARIVILVD